MEVFVTWLEVSFVQLSGRRPMTPVGRRSRGWA